jgi:hypothetical protein
VTAPTAVFVSGFASLKTAGDLFGVSVYDGERLIWQSPNATERTTEPAVFSLSFSQLVSLNPGHHYRVAGVLDLEAFVSGQSEAWSEASAFAMGFGQFFVSPAPEPTTWMLMLAGLGILGGFVKRGRTSEAA